MRTYLTIKGSEKEKGQEKKTEKKIKKANRCGRRRYRKKD